MFSGPGPTARADAGCAPIPRRIWSYWNGAVLDPVVQRCMDNWRLQCPDYRIDVR